MNQEEYSNICDQIQLFENASIEYKYKYRFNVLLDKLYKLIDYEYKYSSSKCEIVTIYKIIQELKLITDNHSRINSENKVYGKVI